MKESIDGMKSFSTEDCIFLLNKWDVISYEDAAIQEQFYEESKAYLHKVFEDVNDSYILKISATKVSTYYILCLKRNSEFALNTNIYILIKFFPVLR